MTSPEERVGPLPRALEERWLTWFLRVLSLVFLVAGLTRWLPILGVPGFPRFSELDTPEQVLTGYLAVVMLLAAVGLWMQASWGTVIWLLAALSEIVAYTAFRDLFGFKWPIVVFHFATLFAYLVLAWRVARTREE